MATNSKLNRNVVMETAETEIIKKGKYRVFNGTNYETVYLQTSSEQVVESESKKFVSQTEKNTWNSKAEGNHNHDSVYAKIVDTYNKTEVGNLLSSKSDVGHTHAASNIVEDSTRRFVTDKDKARWNDTYTTADVDSKVSVVKDAVTALETENAAQHSAITKGYQDADKLIDGKVTTVQGNLDQAVIDLKELINNGGTANTELANRVTTLETTTVPAVKKLVTDLDSRVTGEISTLTTDKADKTQVDSDIAAAKSALQKNIDLKADKKYTDDQLALKANVLTTYTKDEMDASLLLKADKTYVDTELGKKVATSTFNTELAKKANATDVTNSLSLKADVTALESGLAGKANSVHTHTSSQITGLGTAATKNVGTGSGQIPLLNSSGKLETSVLPSIAINDTFTAASTTDAMKLTMEIGDILVLQDSARQAAMDSQSEDGKAITYSVAKSTKTLSDEYTTYIASGRMTYLCVDPSANTFEERFRPLQSSGDTISAAEVQTALNLKVNVSDFNSYKSQVTDNLELKADKADTYTKTQVDTYLANKVDKVSGKGLSTNDFTAAYKTKLDGVEAGANKYVHPTEDGNLHVPFTGTTNNGKVLMAGSSAGALSWTALSTSHISDTATKRFVTDTQITAWNNKAEAVHTHDQYRLISDSFSKSQTTAEINKMKTIISTTQPSAGSHVAGAVWIEEIS